MTWGSRQRPRGLVAFPHPAASRNIEGVKRRCAGFGGETLIWYCQGRADLAPLVETPGGAWGRDRVCELFPPLALSRDCLGAETAVEAKALGSPILTLQGPHGELPTGPGPHQASPPCPGAVVKMEDGWAQSPPVPASCQLGKWTRSPSAAGSPGDDGDTGGIRVPSWGPAAQGEAWVVCSSPHGVPSPPARFCPTTGKERVQSAGEDPRAASPLR